MENVFEELKDKVILITGATSGIGESAAYLFSSLNMKVVAMARNEEKGQMLIKKIIDSGPEALFIKSDVANFHDVEKSIGEVLDRFGKLNYALNCAGIEGNLKLLSESDEDEYDKVMSINLKGIWNCLKFQAPAIAKSKGGAIVNISTNLTRKAIEGTSIYTASKAGVEAFTRVIAIEYGRQKVRINAISPGAVDTPMLRRIFPKGFGDLADGNPLGKIACPKDIAETALWLFSSLSSHVNGETVFVDGGTSLKG